ncbi:hypothetical protein FQR65_LT19147 [Abscondita terminalis]|nr:hypothetical protein FQR65_LT19147 [Abscondita terminalis]
MRGSWRLFKKSNVLTVAASDVLAESPLMKVSDALTDIAEVSVIATLNLAYQTVAKRHGYPIDAEGQRCSLEHMAYCVIGYGKVGGIELGYGSDLDLVFIHYMDEQADTDGQKAISGFEFAMRVAQKFMSLMTTQTLDGRVYEVDTRLRPSGEAGLLVTSLKAFEQYQLKSAWLWEHQAIGSKPVSMLVSHLEPHKRKQFVKKSSTMRQKMKDHLGSSKDQKKDGIFHLKQDAGGIVDIEFMAQYVVLAWSGTNPDLAHYSDNVRILEDAAKAGCLSSDDVSALIQAYLSERAESHRLALANHNMQGVRAYETPNGTAIFRLQDHTKRLLNSAKIYQMKVPFDQATLEQAQIDVVRENKLASCYLRPIIFIGSEKLGIAATDNTIHATVAAWSWGAYLGDEAMAKGIRVKTSSFTHHHPNVTMCKAKASGNYTLSILAHQEVAHSGYDEAMLMDPQGYVCQGSGENVFLVKDGVLHTPDIAGGALDGITRQTIITIAKDLGIDVVERRITRDEFYIGDEAFFTGTAAEVTPIREYDDRQIGSGARGPITEKIQKAFFDAVQGKDPKYAHWLTYVK